MLPVLLALACGAPNAGPPSSPRPAPATAAPAADAPPEPAEPPAPVSEPPPPITDAELGALVEALSEETGDFPSDNFVSNETSYLEVADALESLPEGRAFVGVGPEQNLTYLALARPAIAYVVDIRRENLLEHLALRAAIEDAPTRAEFVARLTARDVPAGLAPDAPFAAIADAFSKQKKSPDLRDAAAARSLALQKRLGITVARGDERAYARIHQAFFAKGLDLAYRMEGSRRPYPPLRAQLSEAKSFVGDEGRYARVREMLRANRVVPVVGDFAGDRALAGVARDIRRRGVVLGAFYASNVEEYLLDGRVYPAFLRNLGELPADERSLVVRVWFDRGRPHPRQADGRRSTTVAVPLAPFLAHAAATPFRTYWDVATWTPG